MFCLDYRIPKAIVVVGCLVLHHPEMACTVNFVENMELGVGTTQINRNKTIMFVARIGHAIIEMPEEWSLGIGRPCRVSGLDQKYYQKKSEIPVLSMLPNWPIRKTTSCYFLVNLFQF